MCTRIIFFSLTLLRLAWPDNWQTYYEKTGFRATPRYQETIEFCRQLDHASPWIQYTSFGKSSQGRDLPLLIVDKNKNFSTEKVQKSGNVIMLIQAGIHAGEIDGKDAGLMLIRDIAITRQLEHLLDHVTILFIPIFNVDGHERFGPFNRANQNGPVETGWRVTAQNLNLNRDYMKADAPEMRAWLRLFNDWLPDFFADCHVTDGADYQYPLTYKMETHGYLDSALINWSQNIYLPQVKIRMEKQGLPIIDYVILRRDNDPRSGLITWAEPPRLSDGYVSIQNRIALLIETHMFKDYKTRVTATYEMLKHTLEILNEQHDTLKKAIIQVDARTVNHDFHQKPLPLTFKYKADSVWIDFLGYDYNIIKSDLSGGDWHRFHSEQPQTMRISFKNKMEAAIKAQLPEAYIIPVEWQSVIERLRLHDITYKVLTDSARLPVSTYRFKNVKFQSTPYEGRQTVRFEAEAIEDIQTFYAGSAVVEFNQRAAKVIAHLFEPQAPDALVYWGFFNAIFEQKEYVESYVMEEKARQMLVTDAQLKREFETKMSADSIFAKNPQAILNWFYQRSPYWDTRKDVYPVGKIIKRDVLKRLKFQPDN